MIGYFFFFSSFTSKKTSRNNVDVVLIDSGISPSLINNLPKNIKVVSYDKKENNNTHADLVTKKMVENLNGKIHLTIHDLIVTNKNNVPVSTLNKKLEEAVKIDPDIIHLSLGVNINNPELKQYIHTLISENIIIVASAGNRFGLSAQYPARYKNVISVGSVNNQNEISTFSARKNVDFYALGEYEDFSGTSFSAPTITTKIIELLYADESYLTADIFPDLQKMSTRNDDILIIKK